MELQPPSEDAMVHTAAARLEDGFPTINRLRIEDSVRRIVRKLCARSRVKTFIGILAERHARVELRQQARRQQE